MDPKNNQVPSGASVPAAPRFTGGHSGGLKMNNNRKMMFGVVAVLVIVLAIIGFVAWKQMSGASSAIKGGQYQALFLTNGQVYFGKLSNVDDKYVRLTDIYYLQVQQNVQPADSKTQPQVSLAKLGSELHGPEDQMEVNRDQVLFWENLKNDGKVVKAIQENQKK
jgi:hypothetical protein